MQPPERLDRPEPVVWILTRGRQGDLDQMQVLAKGLGWPTVVKRLSFRKPHIPALASLLLKPQSDALGPPWPDLVICAEALPSIVARRLKKLSQGRIRLVCVGRPAGDPADFDLIVTTAQYRLPPAGNIVELGMPLSDSSGAVIPHTPLPHDMIRPLIVLTVGGSSFPDRLDTKEAIEMSTAVRSHAEHVGGTVWAFTSPRTKMPVSSVLRDVLRPPHRVHVFTAGPDNPYRSALQAADLIIVTSDSVSMVSDALETGKPVQVYRLPQSRSFEWHVTEWLYRRAVMDRATLFAPVRWLFERGVFEVSADRRLLFSALVAKKRISWFGEAQVAPSTASGEDIDRATGAVLRLFGCG